MRRPKTSHLNAHQLQPRAFAECSETFCHFCIHSFVWRMPRRGSPCASVGKVCKGFRLAVFVWFTLLFSLFFCCCSCCCSCCFFFLWVRNECLNSFYATLRPKWSAPCIKDCGLGFTITSTSTFTFSFTFAVRFRLESGVFGGEKCKRRRTRLATHCSASLQFVDLLR